MGQGRVVPVSEEALTLAAGGRADVVLDGFARDLIVVGDVHDDGALGVLVGTPAGGDRGLTDGELRALDGVRGNFVGVADDGVCRGHDILFFCGVGSSPLTRPPYIGTRPLYALGEPATARVSRYHDPFIRSVAGPVFRAVSCRPPNTEK